MRIVSLLPSATEIVFALGLGDELVGRTHECDYPPEAASIPVMTSSVGGLPGEASSAIHDRVRGALHGGGSIYRLDVDALETARPDLILTQELCEVCAVSYREVTSAVRVVERTHPGRITVVSLEPTSIEGILHTISTVGAMAEAEDEAVGLVEILRERLAAIEQRMLERRGAGAPARRVVCLEWLEPPFAAGHWVPEQVRRAGGWDLLGREGEDSAQTTWDAVRDVDPDQLILIPCGFDAPRAALEWQRAEKPAWVDDLGAVANGEVYALDGSSYFSRPGPRVVDGIGLLAEIFHPDASFQEAPSDGWIRLSR